MVADPAAPRSACVVLIFKNIGAVSARLESRYVRSPKAGRSPMPAAGVVIYFVEVSSSSPIPALSGSLIFNGKKY